MPLPDRTNRTTSQVKGESKRSLAPGPVQVIAVTGGKGGVGKTSVAINLATAMSLAGKRVMLLDGDLGLANVDVLLGLSPRHTLAQVMDGLCSLEEILVEAPQGFHVVPGASGVADMANLSAAEHLTIVQAFSSLANKIDTLIVDTAAGISHGVLQFSQAAQHVLVVVCDEPASITDAYALIKVLSRNHGVREFHVVSNMVHLKGEGEQLFKKLERVTSRFLDVVLQYVGEVPDDPYLKRSIREQRPVTDAYPASPSAMSFKKLAIQADKWPVPKGPRGNLEFFVERLVRRNSVRLEVVQ